MKSWLRWFTDRSTDRRFPIRHRARLGFETLEERTTPAVITELVSFGLDGAANGPSLTSGSAGASIAVNASGERLVVFSSDASNLVDDDTNNATDVFVLNVNTSVIRRVSVGIDDTQANGASFFASISADGRYVAFQSAASNLVEGVSNGTTNIYVKDLGSGVVTLVSAAADQTPANDFSQSPAISANGQYVVFASFATNLTVDATGGHRQIYRKDWQTGSIEMVSKTILGVAGNQNADQPAISADGSFVAFVTAASNLHESDDNGLADVYRKNMTTFALDPVSGNGSSGWSDGASSSPRISDDGSIIAFASSATNLVEGDTNGVIDIFVRTMTSSGITRVSLDAEGSELTVSSSSPSLSGDGRFVAFVTAAPLVENDDNALADVYVKDRATGSVRLISQSSSGSAGNAGSQVPSIAPDGRRVAFTSNASNLVEGDFSETDRVFLATVNQLPVISLAGAATILEGQSLALNASATTDPDNDSLTFTWDLNGDGVFGDATGASISRSPAQLAALGLGDGPATSAAVLRVSDGFESVDHAFTITIQNVEPVMALAPSATVNEGSLYTLPLSVTDPGLDTVLTWKINWGDGTAESILPGAASSASHTYTDGPATWNLIVTATDEDGAYIFTQTITVNDVLPTVTMTGAATAGADTAYILNLGPIVDPGNDIATSARIDWGDGTVQTIGANGFDQAYSHTYTSSGSFSIRVLVDQDETEFVAGVKTVVVDSEIPTIVVGGPAATLEGAAYTLTLNNPVNPDLLPITAIRITWGDGAVTTLPSPFPTTATHSYLDGPASFEILVELLNGDSAYDLPTTHSVEIQDVAPVAELSAPSSVAVNTSFALIIGTIIDPGQDTIASYVVHWGDGNISEGVGPPPGTLSHTYLNAHSSRVITLTVVDDNGPHVAGSATIEVTGESPEVVVNAGDDETIPEGATFTRGGSLSFSGENANWIATVDFGDGPESLTLDGTSFTISRLFPNDGVFHVVVSFSDAEIGTFTDSFTVTVDNVAPQFEAGENAIVNEGSLFTRSGAFSDPGEDTWIITINYGDGSPAQQTTTTTRAYSLNHTYAQDGEYHVTITIDDDATESGSVSESFTVTVNNIAPQFEAGENATINEGSPFTRSGAFSDPGNDTWIITINYGDGSPAQQTTTTTRSYSLNHTYARNGEYLVTITIDDGAADEDPVADSFTVFVNNVAPEFEAGDNATVNEGSPFTRTGTFTDPGNDTWIITINYGDGSPAQQTTTTTRSYSLNHTYVQNGEYHITIAIDDDATESGSVTDTFTVTVNNVAPTLTAGGDGTAIMLLPFTRQGSFVDPGADDWSVTVDFGDGSAPQSFEPNADKSFTLTHSYSQAGTFPVTVTVNDGTANGVSTFNVVVTAPTLTLSANTVPENSAAGVNVGAVAVSDTTFDTGALITLLDSANGRFTLDGRNIVVAAGANLDFETASSHLIQIRAEKNGQVIDQEFTIQITDADDGDDIVGRDPVTGVLYVARSTGTGFVTTSYEGAFDPSRTWIDVFVADFSGDGRDDVIARDANTSEWFLAQNTGTAFMIALWEAWNPAIAWTDIFAGDLNGDGKADLLARNLVTGEWWGSFSQGTTGVSEKIGQWDASVFWVDVHAVDLNKDGRIDVVGRIEGTGDFHASLNQPNSQNTGNAKFNNQIGPWARLTDGNLAGRTTWLDVRIGDVNGDDRPDILGRVEKTGQWYVVLGRAGRPGPARHWTAWATTHVMTDISLADVTGDGRDDIIARSAATGAWHVAVSPANSTTNVVHQTWNGTAVSFPASVVIGDFNRNGRMDLALLRSSDATWHVGVSNGSDFTFSIWDDWPSDPSRVAVRRGRFVN